MEVEGDLLADEDPARGEVDGHDLEALALRHEGRPVEELAERGHPAGGLAIWRSSLGVVKDRGHIGMIFLDLF